MNRFTRLAALAVGVLALVGGVTTPAHATTKAEVTFAGVATVTGGIGYPVTTLPVVTPPPPTTCLPLPGQITQDPLNCHPVYDHSRAVSFSSSIACQDEVTNVNKLSKATETTGTCSISASGTVTGHCGLSGGQVTGSYTDSGGQTSTFGVHFTGVGGELVVSGHVTKNGRTGLITAEVTAVPEPSVPPGTGPSCTNKTQERFTIAGEATGVIVT